MAEFAWVVAAYDWEDSEIRGVFSTEAAGIAAATEEAKREARRRYGGWHVVLTKHRLGEADKGEEVEFLPASRAEFVGVGRSGLVFAASMAAVPLIPPESPSPR